MRVVLSAFAALLWVTGAQARIHAYALQGAGEPVTGLESWLYPIEPPS